MFEDSSGEFTAIRNKFLGYYPENVRRKRMAARLALVAQSGQYNLPRCLRRGDQVAAIRALGEFIDHAQAVFFLLGRRYRPYYKWAHRCLLELPDFGRDAGPLFEALAEAVLEETSGLAERLCQLIAAALREEGLSRSTDDFLLTHAKIVQNTITDPDIRALHLMSFG